MVVRIPQAIRDGIAAQIGTTVGTGIVPTGVTDLITVFPPMPASFATIPIMPVISSKVALTCASGEDVLTCTRMQVTRIRATPPITLSGISTV